MGASEQDKSTVAGAPSLAVLFAICFKIGVTSFGGGLSGWYYREFVETRKLVGEEDFASILALCQMLPGPNIINLVICLGHEIRGLGGAAACVGGFVVGPFFFVIALSVLFDGVSDLADVQIVTAGLAFAALGLLVAFAWQGIRRAGRYWPYLGVIFVLAIGAGVLQWPLLPTVAIAAPVSVCAAWVRLRHAQR